MLKEAILIFFALVAITSAYPGSDLDDDQAKSFLDQEPLEALEGAESANPQWGGRGWGGRGWGGRGGGWGGGGWGGRGWGGGGWGRGGGWGGGRRGWGWGK